MRSTRWALAPVLALTASCSALIDPDEHRLTPPTVLDGGDVEPPLDTGSPDDTAPPPDTGVPMDSGFPDTEPPLDTGSPDDTAPPLDTGTPDTGTPDTGTTDTGTPDTGLPSRCPGGCSDGIECTVDTCNEAAGVCVFRPDNTRCGARGVCDPARRGCVAGECAGDADCQNGNLCDGRERCVGGRCVTGTAVDCADGIVCTVDACIPATGECVHAPDHAACNDAIPCTVDTCDTGLGRCTHAPTPSLCPARGTCLTRSCSASVGCQYAPIPDACASSYCVVGATCSTATGNCEGGAPRDCDDRNPCTVDRCDATARACRSTARDDDNDGFPAATVGATRCTGSDCDDASGAINPGARELCNGTDDNCNGTVDEGCSSSPGETCANAIALDASRGSASATGSTAGRRDDLRSACVGGGGADVVYAITVPASSDVTLELVATGEANLALAVREACGSLDFVCNDDAARATRNTSRIWIKNPPGATGTRVYYATVDTNSAPGPFNLRVTAAAPVGASTCSSSSWTNVTAGGALSGYVPRGTGSHTGICGGSNTTEDVLLVSPTATTRYLVALYGAASAPLYARQPRCGGSGVVDLACDTGLPARLDVSFARGQGFLIADAGSSASGLRYVLTVQPQ